MPNVRLRYSEDSLEILENVKLHPLFADSEVYTEIIQNDPLVYQQKSYSERIQSLTNASKLVIDTLSQQIISKDNITQDAIHQVIANIEKSNALFLEKLLSSTKPIKALSDYKFYIVTELTNIFGANPLETSISEWLGKADAYCHLFTPKPILATLSRLNSYKGEAVYALEGEIPQAPFEDSVLEEFLNAHPSNLGTTAPLWYQIMAPYERAIFDQKFSKLTFLSTEITPENKTAKLEKLRNTLLAIPSILRTIPGLPNFAKHVSILFDEDGEVIKEFEPTYRSAILVPRNIPTKNIELRVKITIQNIQLLVQTFIDNHQKKRTDFTNIDIVLGTLIANLPALDADLYDVKKAAIEIINQNGLVLKFADSEKKETVKLRDNQLLNVNHTINLVRHLKITGAIYGSNITERSIEVLLTKYKNHPDPNVRKILGILEGLTKETPNSISSLLSDQHREMQFASIIDMLISRAQGLSHFTCVSGKDRKGLQTIYTSAMNIYLELYGELPPYGTESIWDYISKAPETGDVDWNTFWDGFFNIFKTKENNKETQNFIGFFIDLFFTRHQEIYAGLMALGSNGMKTIHNNLDDLIIDQINSKSPKIIKDSDRLANGNDLHKISSKNYLARRATSGAVKGLIITLIILFIIAIFIAQMNPIGLGLLGGTAAVLITYCKIGGFILLSSMFIGGILGFEAGLSHEKAKYEKIKSQANEANALSQSKEKGCNTTRILERLGEADEFKMPNGELGITVSEDEDPRHELILPTTADSVIQDEFESHPLVLK